MTDMRCLRRCTAVALALLAGSFGLHADDEPAPPPPAPPELPPQLQRKAPPQPPPDLPDPQTLMRQLQQLDELLAMEPEALDRLRQTIDMIAGMSPEQRDAMRIRLSQITRKTPELEAEIAELGTWIEREKRELLSQYWLSLSDERRDGLRESLEGLPDEEKPAWLDERIEAFREHRDEVFEAMRTRD